MRNKVITVSAIKTPIAQSPGFSKKLLSDYKLDILGLCGYGCRYCSSNWGNYLRIKREIFADEAERQLGVRAYPDTDPSLMIPWEGIYESIESQLVRKPKTWGQGKTLVFSMLTDGFSPLVVDIGLTHRILGLIVDRTSFRIRVLTKNARSGPGPGRTSLRVTRGVLWWDYPPEPLTIGRRAVLNLVHRGRANGCRHCGIFRTPACPPAECSVQSCWTCSKQTAMVCERRSRRFGPSESSTFGRSPTTTGKTGKSCKAVFRPAASLTLGSNRSTSEGTGLSGAVMPRTSIKSSMRRPPRVGGRTSSGISSTNCELPRRMRCAFEIGVVTVCYFNPSRAKTVTAGTSILPQELNAARRRVCAMG